MWPQSAGSWSPHCMPQKTAVSTGFSRVTKLVTKCWLESQRDSARGLENREPCAVVDSGDGLPEARSPAPGTCRVTWVSDLAAEPRSPHLLSGETTSRAGARGPLHPRREGLRQREGPPRSPRPLHRFPRRSRLHSQAREVTTRGVPRVARAAYLLGVAAEHRVDQLDAVGQAGGNHVAWAVGRPDGERRQPDSGRGFPPLWEVGPAGSPSRLMRL